MNKNELVNEIDMVDIFFKSYKKFRGLLDMENDDIIKSISYSILKGNGYAISEDINIEAYDYTIKYEANILKGLREINKLAKLGAEIECEKICQTILNLITIYNGYKLTKNEIFSLLHAIIEEEKIELLFNFGNKSKEDIVNYLFEKIVIIGGYIANLLYVEHKKKYKNETVYGLFIMFNHEGVLVIYTTPELIDKSIIETDNGKIQPNI